MSYTQSHPRAFEALLKMESVDMTDDEYMGGLGTRSMSKVKYPTYRQPIPYPSLLKRPPSSSRQTYNPLALWGVQSPKLTSTLGLYEG